MYSGQKFTITENNRQIQVTYEELVRRLADIIWKHWQQELQRERERKGLGRR